MPSDKDKRSGAVPSTLKVPLLGGVVLAYHALTFSDPDVDADRSAEELVEAMEKSSFGRIKLSYIESGLYYCNLSDEKGKFWHPQGKSFENFVAELLPNDLAFHRFYNVIIPRKYKGPRVETEETES